MPFSNLITSVKREVKISTANNINLLDQQCIYIFSFHRFFFKKNNLQERFAVMTRGDELTVCVASVTP